MQLAVPAHEAQRSSRSPEQKRLGALALGALGVVFGDIGTSPLYALRECFLGSEKLPATQANVLGVLSLVFWALMLVVTIKYLVFVMRADNRGEGGIFALIALLGYDTHRRLPAIVLLGMVGAALLYGDGLVTPAISVLSAIEGLDTVTHELEAFIVPLTCVVLLVLFAAQSRGTGGIGKIFGPVMLLWFVTIAALGLYHIARFPSVLRALSPSHAASFFLTHGPRGVGVLGAVILAVTGGEALYADMGHFGRPPIRLAWSALVLPSLVLCYFGQGALLLREPAAVDDPFYAMVPTGAPTLALVVLATAATIIASQALISGVFSLTHQAMELGLFPRLQVKHTSSVAEGQIYVPAMNAALAVGCIALVLVFRASGRLASAYGLAVSGTMAITSIVFYRVAIEHLRWRRAWALALLIFFLAFDIPFFVANTTKFVEGGYVPLMVGAAVMALMLVWQRGRMLLRARAEAVMPSVSEVLRLLCSGEIVRTPGGAVYLTSGVHEVPAPLVQQMDRFRSLPEIAVMLQSAAVHTPVVDPDERFTYRDVGCGLYSVVVRHGYMETLDIPAIIERVTRRFALPLSTSSCSYVVAHVTFLSSKAGRMGPILESIFSFLARNAASPTRHFHLPADRVVELGMQVDL